MVKDLVSRRTLYGFKKAVLAALKVFSRKKPTAGAIIFLFKFDFFHFPLSLNIQRIQNI